MIGIPVFDLQPMNLFVIVQPYPVNLFNGTCEIFFILIYPLDVSAPPPPIFENTVFGNFTKNIPFLIFPLIKLKKKPKKQAAFPRLKKKKRFCMSLLSLKLRQLEVHQKSQ